MNNWHSKTLGCSTEAFKALRHLRELRYQHSDVGSASFQLAVDVMTAETIAFFPPESAHMAIKFGAFSCSAPVMDGTRLRRLDFEPVEIKHCDSAFWSSFSVGSTLGWVS